MTQPNLIGNLEMPVIRHPRTTSIDLHAHLRQLIISGILPPGTTLKQAELARTFHVSRTPMREAFRMLQEEGLIDADPNQRPRVRGLDPSELDTLYAGRIALEALGARITTGRLEVEEIEQARQLLALMNGARENEAMPEWLRAHRQFHRICSARANAPMARTIARYAEQSERYLLTYQSWHPRSFARAHREHVVLLRALSGTDAALSASLMAEHLSHTALNVLQDLESTAIAVTHALEMATGTSAH